MVSTVTDYVAHLCLVELSFSCVFKSSVCSVHCSVLTLLICVKPLHSSVPELRVFVLFHVNIANKQRSLLIDPQNQPVRREPLQFYTPSTTTSYAFKILNIFLFIGSIKGQRCRFSLAGHPLWQLMCVFIKLASQFLTKVVCVVEMRIYLDKPLLLVLK